MEIPWDKLVNVVSLVVLVGQGVLAWIFWSMRKSFVPREHCDGRCKEGEDRMGNAESRMSALEMAHKVMPSTRDINNLSGRLGTIEGELKGMSATLEGQAEVMRRIETPLNLLLQYHLKGDPK